MISPPPLPCSLLMHVVYRIAGTRYSTEGGSPGGGSLQGGGQLLVTQSRGVKQSHAPTQMFGSKKNKLRSTARVLFTKHTGKR